MSTPQQTPTVKRDLQSMLLDQTPLRLSDKLRTELQEKTRESQREQAAKMIKTQARTLQIKEQLQVLWLLYSVITAQSAILSELLVLFTR
jgi:hypothetical protein